MNLLTQFPIELQRHADWEAFDRSPAEAERIRARVVDKYRRIFDEQKAATATDDLAHYEAMCAIGQPHYVLLKKKAREQGRILPAFWRVRWERMTARAFIEEAGECIVRAQGRRWEYPTVQDVIDACRDHPYAWLHKATRWLCVEAKNRIADEIEAAYARAVATHRAEGRGPAEARRAALAELGPPRDARKRFCAVYLTAYEEAQLARIRKTALLESPIRYRSVALTAAILASAVALVFIAGGALLALMPGSSSRTDLAAWTRIGCVTAALAGLVPLVIALVAGAVNAFLRWRSRQRLLLAVLLTNTWMLLPACFFLWQSTLNSPFWVTLLLLGVLLASVGVKCSADVGLYRKLRSQGRCPGGAGES